MNTVKEAKSFSEVFGNIELSRGLINALRKVKVERILINQEVRKMEVFLLSQDIIHEIHLDELKATLEQEFEQIDSIAINIKYDFEIDAKDALKISKENIHYLISSRSPLCGNLIGGADYELDENKLIFHVKKNCSYVLYKKEADKLISTYLSSRFGIHIQVHFKDVEKKASNDKYTKNLKALEDELVEKMIIHEEPQVNSNNNSGPSQGPNAETNEPQKAQPRKRLKSTVKVLESMPEADTALDKDLEIDKEAIVEGQIFDIDIRTTKSGLLIISFDITDFKNSITIKMFSDDESYDEVYSGLIKEGNFIRVKGKIQFDDFTKEINIMAKELFKPDTKKEERMDNAPEKRIELHLHTQMSAMDAVTSVSDYIKTAAKWGHKAIAVTDHGVVQAFPEAMESAKKHGIKVIYGVEAYLVDDISAIVQCPKNQDFNSEYIVFDIETTGLRKETCSIIEIGAVKIKNGEIIDDFQALINPFIKLPQEIIELTKITDKMLEGKPAIDKVLKEFIDFCGDGVLVAHNANFDVGFIARWAEELYNMPINNTVLDTVELSRALFPELNNHKLNIVAENLGISLKNHHRAVDDARATAEIFLKCIELLKAENVFNLKELNEYGSKHIKIGRLRTYHAIILVQNYTGLRNLYELISKSHIEYYQRRPRIPKSEYLKLKEGLLMGTACEAGEFYRAVFDRKPQGYIDYLAQFYDYFEVQPIDNNLFMVRDKHVKSRDDLIEINKKIIEYAKKYNKPVVAACDAHFLNSEDEIFRRIIMAGDGFEDADLQAPLYFRTTEEMLSEFSYLPPDLAEEIVITNTNIINTMIEEIKPIPDETFPPKIEGAEEELTRLTMEKAKSIYGDPLPQIVNDRIDRELGSIIKNGFSVMYIIAQKLVSKSESEGYLVGSRGSVGSSFVATMSGITEVNPLPPHYVCPNCKYSEFDSEDISGFISENPGGSGCDMKDKLCPICKTPLNKDGHDIPFETFLGFDGDKEPDIDLNFSGEYQAKAHAYTEELFGEGHVFKAGTIGTLADKTAYGYVKKYFEERGVVVRNAEVNRIKKGLTGIKRTTGQHPGGLMVVPNDHSIYEFCPVQRPANDNKSNVTTTHFDYHSISGRLLKLDILGHDVPTIIRMLHDTTGIDPQKIPLGDPKVISLFTSPEALGVTEEDIECKTGSLGLPEFGTSFVRQMLLDTRPSSFGELVRISGLSHGTDVWFNNAQELIRKRICTLKEVIPTRDDIMVYLIAHGVEKKTSFKIMESVRKGKGLTKEYEEVMLDNEVPEWYIDSCKKIKYMFPKGHAVAYVMMTVRIGYFKIYYPYSFYAAIFSVKFEDFDYEIMCKGRETARNELKRIRALGNDASAKEKNLMTTLELVNEMYARGLNFIHLNLYEANTTKFKVFEDGIMPPLCSIQGLGETVAQNIIEARKDGEFLSIEEFRERTKATKTVIELLKKNNLLEGIPETNQLSLF
ncbi:PolC-type DNA polymerase III [Anaeropeptidivorans aminofermentans]|uniref:PolC-type DNA polymerase III n=1 Tax=Anaeropeptidivorans aminofermentans TaxID=2934315 RepID=UPI0020243681|nr:PolC-type DNA polymerase III [Anaeropeptidivorans aminofermentans]